MSATIGRVLLIPKGDYSGSTTYNALDWVRYSGASWVCKVDGTVGVVPPTLPTTSNANWQVLAEDGSVSGAVDWNNVNNKPFDDITVGGGLDTDGSHNLMLDPNYLIGSNIGYDNSGSGLTADDVQEAIDELAGMTVDLSTDLLAGSNITLTTKPDGKVEIASTGGGTVVDTQTSLDGTTVTFSNVDVTKSYMLQADYPNNYNGAPVGMTNFQITNSGGVYSITYTVTNATVNQSFDLVQIG